MLLLYPYVTSERDFVIHHRRAAGHSLLLGEVSGRLDVIAHLEEIDANDGRNLNWRTSIVDLMKMVGMDASLQERKDLAMELGYTGELEGSAEMNIWLHKAVMRELAANGGKVPAELLD